MSQADDPAQDRHGHQLPHSLALEIVDGPCSGASFAPSGTQLAVGRTKASQIWIKDSAVSEKHAVFAWEQAAWTLRDMGSSNGTLVNGRALEGEGPSVQLKDGDMIQFGTDTRARVEVVPVCDEHVTVEQYLEAEMQRQVQKIKEYFPNNLLGDIMKAAQAASKSSSHLQPASSPEQGIEQGPHQAPAA